MASIGEIAETLRGVVTPGMQPKDIRVAVRKSHPDASKKEIVRAAFYALTADAHADGAAIADLHGFALGERGADEEAEPKVGKRRRKDRRSEKAAHQPAP